MMLKRVFVSKFILLVLAIPFMFFLPSSLLAADSSSLADRKAVVLVIDQIGSRDLLKAKTPNIDLLIENGGIGLMNVRPEAIINTNRASTYLSLGMGTRVTAPKRKEWQLDRKKDNTWLLRDTTGVSNQVPVEKQDKIGLIGKTARQKGLKIGLIGNGDYYGKHHREVALMAMDESGTIPNVAVETPMQEKALKKILSNSNIIFVDLGSTTKVQAQRGNTDDKRFNSKIKRAIEENDKLLGMIINEIGFKNNFFVIVTPNPSPQGIKDINLTLTPLIVYNPLDKNKNGVLTSSSTRREGLVTNLNFAPTLFSYFGLTGLGETIKVSPAKVDPKEATAYNERLFLNLNKTRYLLHGTYIFLIVFTLILYYTKVFPRLKKGVILSWLSLITLNIPLSSLVAPLFLDYSKIFFGHLVIVLTSVIITWASMKYLKNFIKALNLSSLTITVIILFDLFRGNKYLVQTPFGFNDVIIGGRFYGINNDLMGILLGAALTFLFTTSHLFNLRKKHQVLLVLTILGLTSFSLSPLFGANVGGTIGAVFILIASVFIVMSFELTIKRIIGIITFVVLLEIGIAMLENSFSNDLTHAGKLYLSVLNNGFIVFIEMIKVKLSQIGLMLVLPPWNFVLFFEIYLIWRIIIKETQKISDFQEKFPHIFNGAKILVTGSVVIFAFNDTGVISSAMMLTNALLPYGYLTRLSQEG